MNLNLHHLPGRRSTALFGIGLVLGAFIVVQSRSSDQLTLLRTRDASSNVFREIQILKNTNEHLSDAIVSLRETLAKANDKSQSLQSLETEVKKYQILSGLVGVYGPGITVSVPDNSDPTVLVDLANDLYASGAETVSVNGIRLSNTMLGFETIPNGQVILHGTLLQAPYVFSAIGESGVLEGSLRQAGGAVQRYERHNPGKTLTVGRQDRIDMHETLYEAK